ncbi:hypothetical protein KSP39_PZI019129 [Platanthera zijinensis]|uniref:Uncharacterized protein n=1 Tax=Platanthera zijinensis TaxID=2320716 RepID=A0AAP0FYM0_9ASPA
MLSMEQHWKRHHRKTLWFPTDRGLKIISVNLETNPLISNLWICCITIMKSLSGSDRIDAPFVWCTIGLRRIITGWRSTGSDRILIHHWVEKIDYFDQQKGIARQEGRRMELCSMVSHVPCLGEKTDSFNWQSKKAKEVVQQGTLDCRRKMARKSHFTAGEARTLLNLIAALTGEGMSAFHFDFAGNGSTPLLSRTLGKNFEVMTLPSQEVYTRFGAFSTWYQRNRSSACGLAFLPASSPSFCRLLASFPSTRLILVCGSIRSGCGLPSLIRIASAGCPLYFRFSSHPPRFHPPQVSYSHLLL